MASSSGTSSGSSTLIPSSGSDEDLQQALMNERKRKRMISNRESARRSRMRKQKHVDDLAAQVNQLQKENHEIITRLNITTQHYLNVEADNTVLRAQANELGHRLQSLNEIITFLNGTNGGDHDDDVSCFAGTEPAADNFLNNPFNLDYLNQPIMASADNMFQY